jgi:hypothetical protein
MNSDCRCLSLMSQFIDDELPEEERSKLAEHIAQCETCTREIENLKKLRSTLALLGSDLSAKQRILKSLSSQKPKMAFAARSLMVPLPVAASIILLLGVSVIGNAYLGFFRPIRQQIVYKSVASPDRVSDSEKEAVAAKKIIEPAVKQPTTTDSQSIDSGTFHQKHNRVNVASVRSDTKSFVATLQTDRYSAEFTTTTEYRLYPIPKIYSGGINSSE